MKTVSSLLLPLLLAGSVAMAAPPPAAATRPPTFEELLGALGRAEQAGNAEAAARALAEIRRVRIERNIGSHEMIGLALVRQGAEKLSAGDREGAEEAFRNATTLAPGLPDAHFGLAVALLRKGVLGVVPSINASVSGAAAFLATQRGQTRAWRLLTVAGLGCGLAVVWTVALVLGVRRGGLLKHDIEEWLVAAGRKPWTAPVMLALALLPVALFQGWGWLPLWWLALLFAYFDRRERIVVGVLALATLLVAPALSWLEFRLRTLQNPLFTAALSAIEDAPAAADLALLERSAREDPGDRDLQYLLGSARKRAGLYEDAAQLYRSVLESAPQDPFARNNLANLDFARGAFDAALARYKAGTEDSGNPEHGATSYYNLSLAYLQKFDYQAYDEAKSNADRLAGPVVQQYDRWKYDSGDYAVVDLGLVADQLWAKIDGRETGVARRNVASAAARGQSSGLGGVRLALLARFAGAIALLAIVPGVIGRWRGRKAFTLHCSKCGAAFCRLCHLSQASGSLCSQCYHLFVVRDGVSGPARNRKMAEVQRAESRRNRVFRLLSVVAPGAGHVFGGRILTGLPILCAWYAILSLVVASRMVPLTDVSAGLFPPWAFAIAGVLLLLVWVLAFRAHPEEEAALPVPRRPGPRRARVAQGA